MQTFRWTTLYIHKSIILTLYWQHYIHKLWKMHFLRPTRFRIPFFRLLFKPLYRSKWTSFASCLSVWIFFSYWNAYSFMIWSLRAWKKAKNIYNFQLIARLNKFLDPPTNEIAKNCTFNKIDYRKDTIFFFFEFWVNPNRRGPL